MNNKIDWKRGMEITPATFIEADNYHDSIRRFYRLLIAPVAYGLIPQSDFVLEYDFRDNNLLLKKISCTILDADGHLLQLTKGATVPLPKTVQGVYYLAVSFGGENHIEENGVPYVENICKYQIINLLNPDTSSLFPIAKLYAGPASWEVLDFIPPCYTLSAHSELVDLSHHCRQSLQKLYTLLGKKERGEAFFQLGSLLIEMINAVHSDTVPVFVSRLKKIVLVLQNNHLLDEHDSEWFDKAETFVWQEYNPNAIFETIQEALSLIHAATALLERAKVEPVPVVEKPKPEPEEEEFTYML